MTEGPEGVMKLKVLCALVATLLLWATPALADSFQFSLTLLPGSGAITGAAGDTIGWGYTITNLDSTNWLETTSLNTDLFQNATPDAFLFDLPIIAPGSSVTVQYAAGTAGLFELTWDTTAAVGFSNQGMFVLSGDFYDGDPFSGGQFLQSGLDATAAYSATVAGASSPVPEPGTAWLLLIALAGWGGLRGHRARAPVLIVEKAQEQVLPRRYRGVAHRAIYRPCN